MHRIVLASLLVLVLGAAALVLLRLGAQPSATDVSAASFDEDVRMDLVATGPVSGDCSTVGITDFTTPPKCTAHAGIRFDVQVILTTIPPDPDGLGGNDAGWEAWASRVAYSGMLYHETFNFSSEFKSPGSYKLRDTSIPGSVGHLNSFGGVSPPYPESQQKGAVLNLLFSCNELGTISLVPADSLLEGAAFQTQEGQVPLEPPPVELDVNCLQPPDTRMDLVVPGIPGCTTEGVDFDNDPTPKCTAVAGSAFNLQVVFTTIPDDPDGPGPNGPGWEGWQSKLEFSGVTYNPDPVADYKASPNEHKHPQSVPLRANFFLDAVSHADATSLFPPFPESTIAGAVLNLSFTCNAAGTVELIPRGPPPDGDGSLFVVWENQQLSIPPAVALDVNCATPTPSPTPTNTPSAPGIIKGDGTTQLVNLWLTAQARDDASGDLIKIPPVNCLDSTDSVSFPVGLTTAVTGIDKAGDPRELGAFSFEVHYPDNKVCVEIIPGAVPNAWSGQAGAPACGVWDSRTKPSLQGVASIHCNRTGKQALSPPLAPADELALAEVIIRPMPDQYSVLKPNNGSGNVVQIHNTACKVGDVQGDPIVGPLGSPSCNDAGVTIRYLEGDVDPNCVIDVSDAQAVAFRWNTSKGTLLYLDRFNLEPSGAQADNDIDVLDLQFVNGRFGSTCDNPHPPQDPVNGKSG